jgi:uncharacterized protein (DUF1697 family)
VAAAAIAGRGASEMTVDGGGDRLKSVPITVSYAAFLRAVNVGKHNRVRMADVRDVVAVLGYTDVRTYLPTGNVALCSADTADVVADRIERALTDLGLRDVDVMVRTRDELASIDGSVFEPYPPDGFRRMVIFTRQSVEDESLPHRLGDITVVAAGAALLAVLPASLDRPINVNAVVEKRWKTRATTRWWNVVEDFRRDVLG